MPRLGELGYLVCLVLSTQIIYVSFSYAAMWRGYQAIGAEYFTILLPLLAYAWRIKSIEKENKKEE